MATYNGWKNRETWLFNLWWDNEEYLANELGPALVEEVSEKHEDKKKRVYYLAERLEDYALDPDNGFVPDLGASFAADLLAISVAQIDFCEIAESMLKESSSC